MRLPFPTAISLPKATMFAAALFAVEQIQHTDLVFSLLVFSFIVLSTFTFNVAGGFSRPSGSYIFFFAAMTVVIAVTWKAVLGEPAQTRLETPVLDLALYNASMLGMLVAILFKNVVLAGQRSFSSRIGADDIDLGNAGLGCFIMFVMVMVLDMAGTAGTAHIVTALNQVNFFGAFAVILSTLHTIRQSGGRRTLDWISGTALVVSFLWGLIGFSKQGMFAPPVGWLIVVASTRFKLRWFHVVSIATSFVLAFFVLVPFSQLGRDLVLDVGPTFSDHVDLMVSLLSHPLQLHSDFVTSQNLADEQSAAAGQVDSYYNSSQGFIDRLSIMPADDVLIAFSDAGHTIGLAPLKFDFINWIPHFLLPDKEKYNVGGGLYGNQGNYYSHEMGRIGPDDFTTGISFSATSEAYHLEGWEGILLLAPPLWFALFLVSDFLCGDPRKAPWGLFLIVYFAHTADEGTLATIVAWLWLGTIGQVMLMLFSLRFAPILGVLLSGHLDRRRALSKSVPAPLAAVQRRA